MTENMKQPTKRQARRAEIALCRLVDLEGLIREYSTDQTNIGEALSTVCDALSTIADSRDAG